MNHKYDNYIKCFSDLSLEDKREYIIQNLKEIVALFYKINIDYNKTCDILPLNEYETEEEYLNELFKEIISLKGISGNIMDIIASNLYE